MFENPFVTTANDLVTTYEARRARLLKVFLRKELEANEYLNKARALFALLKQKTKTCRDILGMTDQRDVFLEAAGVTNKTQRFLDDELRTRLLNDFIEKIVEPTGDKYVDEIVYRYLMALGGQLGGRMCNIIGTAARGELTISLINQLELAKYSFHYQLDDGSCWVNGQNFRPRLAESVKSINWKNGGHERMLVYNLNVDGIGGRSKNVDIVVFNVITKDSNTKTLKNLMGDSKVFHLMGELKGGNDPAGGDEHWKTANGSLQRIREAYKKAYVVFIDASIEKQMAKDIFLQLQNGQIDYAANLTNENQLNGISRWIIEQ